ncbi:hypothetical protein IIY68_00465 [Candidatus Saccharibacteria bacterium]|nr:hypothetical protein [Candidatus Saccharibacteria bacterium]
MKARRVITILAILIPVLVLIIVLILLMRGETKTSGDSPVDIEGESLACESHSIKYPFFATNEAQSSDFRIIASFYGEKLNAISLEYTLFYDTKEQLKASEAHNHAAMNISFGNSGLSADAFDANYSKMGNAMKMLLFVKEEEFDMNSAKYFMSSAEKEEELPNNIDEFEKVYMNQGFVCNIIKG